MTHKPKSYAEAARRAIEAAGGATAVARRLSFIKSETVNMHRVDKWKRNGVPPAWVLHVEAVTGVSRSQLRPDIYPPYLK